MTARLFAGIDIGGSATKIGIFDARGNLLRESAIATEPLKRPQSAAMRIRDEVHRLLPRGMKDALGGAGVGVPGLLDREKGLLLLAPNLPRWRRFAIRKTFEKKLHVPVKVENDANCAALGELSAGAAKGVANSLTITLGTGIGGGLILRGKLWTGNSGMAGEFGHMGVDPKGPRCGCGAVGCLETIASATGIWRAAREAGLAFSSVEEIFAQAKVGEPKARRAVQAAGEALGRAIGAVVQLLDIRLFILTGGLSAQTQLLLPSIKSELRTRIYGRKIAHVKVVRSRLGERAGIYGAATLVRE